MANDEHGAGRPVMDETTTGEACSRERGLLIRMEEPPRTALAAALSSGCAITVVTLLITTLMGVVFSGMSEGLAISLTIIVAGMAGGLLQQLCFNHRVLRLHVSEPARVALFGVAYLAVLVPCAVAGGWMPSDVPGAWMTFGCIYLVILAACTLFFTWRRRRQNAEYARRLESYRARRGRER